VALLEARIQEDPRGDMYAWMNLLADHKRRSRLDDLRRLYNRFLEVFPQAVSRTLCYHTATSKLT
jgi:cleavage stimulation factor subunit 3